MDPRTPIHLEVTLGMVQLFVALLRKTTGFPHEVTDPALATLREQVDAQLKPKVVEKEQEQSAA